MLEICDSLTELTVSSLEMIIFSFFEFVILLRLLGIEAENFTYIKHSVNVCAYRLHGVYVIVIETFAAFHGWEIHAKCIFGLLFREPWQPTVSQFPLEHFQTVDPNDQNRD